MLSLLHFDKEKICITATVNNIKPEFSYRD